MESHDAPLEPLKPLSSLLPQGEPFTAALAAQVGVGRAALGRMLRVGVLRRPVRGVYVDASIPDALPLRAQALALHVPEGRVVVGRTAAWLHGLTGAEHRGRLETASPGARLPERDLITCGGVRATGVVRTALDVGRTAPADEAVAMLDAFLQRGLVRHRELLAALPAVAALPGAAQLRTRVALADGRAACAAESVLRLRWCAASLPTPIPRIVVGEVFLELALPARRFGAVLAGRLDQAQLDALAGEGWRIVVLPTERLLNADPQFLISHLEREYLQHLLEQVG